MSTVSSVKYGAYNNLLIILRIFSILQRYTLLFLLKIGRFQEQSSKMDGCSQFLFR